MVVHLGLRDDILCWTPARRPATTSLLNEVTCVRCTKALVDIARDVRDELMDRRIEAMYTNAADQLGVRHVWDSLSADNPYDRIMRRTFGAVIVGLVESHADAMQAAS